jgi:arylsulfatase A-like enzyme
MMCDQLNASALSCYGGPVPTPNIDRIASQGVRFTNATCVTPYCSPTRASIVTGMYPHAHGIVLNCAPKRQTGITGDDCTTEKLLHEAGYATHHYGKWHLNGDSLPYYQDMFRPSPEYTQKMKPVFASARKRPYNAVMKWYSWALPVTIDPKFQRQVDKLGDKWKDKNYAEFITKMGRLELPIEQCYDVQVAEHTCKKLKKVAAVPDPFMVTCSFVWPHDPNVVPSPYYEMFDPKKIELPANRNHREQRFEKNWAREIVRDLGEPGLREFLRGYYAMVKLIDDQVGRILDVLDKSGRSDDTIVVFTADHGDMMGGHGMVWKSTSAFYEEVVRVPLIIRYPAKFKPATTDMLTDSTDLMPTLLDLIGKPIPKQAQGHSLVPFITGKKPLSEARKYVFSERVRGNPRALREVRPGTKGSFMIRSERYKFIRYDNGEQFLYDLAEDPCEIENLVNVPDRQRIRRRLSDELDRWLNRTGWTG